MAEILQGMAATVSVLLSQTNGDIREVMVAIGGVLRHLHMDDNNLERRRQVEDPEMLQRMAQEGLPAEIRTRGDLASELVNGNHRSTTKHRGDVLDETKAHIALSRVIVFRVTLAKDNVGLRISPVGLVEEMKKV